MEERGRGYIFLTFVICEKSNKSIQYQKCMLLYFTDCMLIPFRLSKSKY